MYFQKSQQTQNGNVPPASCRQCRGLRIRHRGRLPHWEIEGATYFVTFRLDDSIPQNVADLYRFERHNIIKTAEQLKRPLTETELDRLQKLHSKRIENYLDNGAGGCFLRQPSIAKLTQDALEYFNTNRYTLYSWCIMPNHVHVLFQPLKGFPLNKILHSWKSYTAVRANRLLNRSGAFWQREYYDHLIRNEQEFDRCMTYILDNPLNAGLKNWPWVKLYENDEQPL